MWQDSMKFSINTCHINPDFEPEYASKSYYTNQAKGYEYLSLEQSKMNF